MEKTIVLFLFILANIAFAQSKYDDWEVAKKESESTKKKNLIILTGAEWCKPCVKMEKNVIESTEFIEYAKENLVILKINLPRHWNYDSKVVKDYERFKSKYKTNALPSLILVDKDGKEITKMTTGLNSLEKVMKQLKQYK